MCTQNKSSNQPPVSLLNPLLWSLIALDFVNGLPSSSGNTVTLTVVDQFSTVDHFIPYLISATEMAQVVNDHVFWIHGLPEDVVSDRCPFITHFWREFSSLSASLSSEFHPQMNCQTICAKQVLGWFL